MEHADFLAEWESRDQTMMALAKLRCLGMTYTKISSLIGTMSAQKLSHDLKPYEKRYKDLCEKNWSKLEESLNRNDPDYDYLADPRTVLQQNCALLLGGDEMLMVLKQLEGLK